MEPFAILLSTCEWREARAIRPSTHRFIFIEFISDFKNIVCRPVYLYVGICK